MRGRLRWGSPRLRLGVALIAGLVLMGGCRGEDPAAEGQELEPRIVTEGPVDAPGRPEGRGEVVAIGVGAEEGGRWVPHLTVGDLAASVEFYRGLGFATEGGGEATEGRVELERDGVRLVLVEAAADAAAAPEAVDAGGEEETAAAGEEESAASAVLHLVDEAGGARREVRDPDGHLLVIPGG